LISDYRQVCERMNRGGKNTLIVPSEYLQIVITRR